MARALPESGSVTASACDLAGVDGLLRPADGRDLGGGEDVGGDLLEVQRGDRVAEEVPHRDPALHGGHRGEHQHAGAVAGGVHPARGGARDPVDVDEAAVLEDHAGLLEAEVVGVGDRAEGEDAVRALDGPAVGEGHGHHVAGAGHRLHPRPRQHGHAAPGEHLLEHRGGVGVLAGQHPVAAGDQGDRDAEGQVAGRELRAGDAGADHDQLGRHLVEVVDLLPGQDPLAVRLGGGQRARRGAGGDQDGVGAQDLLGAVGVSTTTRSGPARLPRPWRTWTPSFSSRRAMSSLCAWASALTRWLTRARSTRTPSSPDHHAELVGAGDVGHQLGGRDQRLAGHAVGEHRRAAQPVGVDDRDLGAELGGDQGGLVAARAAADDDDVVGHEAPVRG